PPFLREGGVGMVWDARVQGRRRVAGVEPADLTAIYRSNRRLRTGHPHTSSSPRTFKRRLRSLNIEALRATHAELEQRSSLWRTVFARRAWSNPPVGNAGSEPNERFA